MEKLKVCSFNIRCPAECDGKNYWPYRKDIVNDFIKNEGLDIICMQEVTPAVKEGFILDHPDYQFFGDFRFVPQLAHDETPLVGLKKGKFYVLEYCRKWLSFTPDVPESKFISDTYWPRVYVELKLKDVATGYEFYLINTHFELDDFSISQAYLQIQNRVKQLKSLGYEVLLFGDLNNTKAFFDKYSDGTLVDLTDNLPYSFQCYGNKDKYIKIDFVMSTNKNLTVKSALREIIKDGVYISDHFPVVVDIEGF
jgi:endonuclease/exonuclease/phosphatase family metal-dependent hydrolase